MTTPTQTPGWYPDPEGGHGERWWNGVSWSDARRGVPTLTPTTLLPPLPPAAATVPAPARVVYSAENPAPQAPGHVPVVPMSSVVTVNARVNPLALYGFIAGVVALFLNFLLVPSVLAIILSARGLRRAAELQAAGQTQTLRPLAIAGLVLGAVGAAIGVVQFVLVMIGVVGSFSVGPS